MKKILICVFMLIYNGIAQDSLENAMAPDSENDTVIAVLKPALETLGLEDFKKFYIGFTSIASSLEVITLDIKHTEAADSAITFQYTLNTHDNREDGTGRIWLQQSRIWFNNYEEGKISLPEDGKIVFESVNKDSLKYWKLKEK